MSRISIFLTVMILLLFSCEEGYLTDCTRCYTSEDYNVVLRIDLRDQDRSMENPVLTLYEGPVSDGIIIEKYSIIDPNSLIYYRAILYKDYSATLEFRYNGRQYVSTAGACPKIRYDETTCEEPCWYIYDNILDLSLRYN
ncbi:MAG: hypothetical protein ACM3NP_09940 [Actinomycetota bacterium]